VSHEGGDAAALDAAALRLPGGGGSGGAASAGDTTVLRLRLRDEGCVRRRCTFVREMRDDLRR